MASSRRPRPRSRGRPAGLCSRTAASKRAVPAEEPGLRDDPAGEEERRRRPAACRRPRPRRARRVPMAAKESRRPAGWPRRARSVRAPIPRLPARPAVAITTAESHAARGYEKARSSTSHVIPCWEEALVYARHAPASISTAIAGRSRSRRATRTSSSLPVCVCRLRPRRGGSVIPPRECDGQKAGGAQDEKAYAPAEARADPPRQREAAREADRDPGVENAVRENRALPAGSGRRASRARWARVSPRPRRRASARRATDQSRSRCR